MQRNDMERGLSNLEEQLSSCKACLMGKQAKFPFKKSTWRATERLQLIHTYLCGPPATPSLSGSRYFIILIDDYTRMCWIYFMNQKLEVAEVFLKFKRWIKNQSSCKIQVIRYDNGIEYTLHKGLTPSVRKLESNITSLFRTLHNKMELVRGKTEPLWR